MSGRGHFVSLPGGHAEWVIEPRPGPAPKPPSGDIRRDKYNAYMRAYMARRRAANRSKQRPGNG